MFVLVQVVLDLDETLVCAHETSSLPAGIRSTAIAAGLEWFEFKCVSSEKVGQSFDHSHFHPFPPSSSSETSYHV